jgi:hypothetical protein
VDQRISAVVVFVFASTLQLGARQLTQAVWYFHNSPTHPTLSHTAGNACPSNRALAVAELFHAGSAFGSFAFHRYQDAYLSGIPGWLAIKGGQ